MALDKDKIYRTDERASLRLRCPECHAPLAVTWRRASRSGRSEDLFSIAKVSCRNHCDYDPEAFPDLGR
jgi:hypothetical protein